MIRKLFGISNTKQTESPPPPAADDSLPPVDTTETAAADSAKAKDSTETPAEEPLSAKHDESREGGGQPGKSRPFSLHYSRLSEKTFEQFASLVRRELGIKMPEKKKVMLESRLRKRLKYHGMDNFEEYADFVFNNEHGFDEELIHLLDVVTTNKTEFFREPKHYVHMKEIVLPDVVKSLQGRPLRLWSAACSTGEEPYTLAIVMSEFARENKPFEFVITASDVSTDVLYKAHEAIYREERVAPVDEELLKRYFLRSKDPAQRRVRVCKELRQTVRFVRVNFMEEEYGIEEEQDIIFCRNAMIYFEREIQGQIINKLCKHLRVGGYFFLGHSETLMGIATPLEQVRPAVYRKV